MMDAFNITAIQGLGYNISDLMLADPLKATWRAKEYTSSDAQSNLNSILAAFAATEAYNNVSTKATENSGDILAQIPLVSLYVLSFVIYMSF